MTSPAGRAGRAFSLVVFYFAVALLAGWLLKRQAFVAISLAKLSVLPLLMLNAALVCLGIPLSAVGDLLLLKKVGIIYLAYWPFFVAMISCAQIFFFRAPLFRSWSIPLVTRLREGSSVDMPGRTGQAAFVLLIRAVPLMPFMAGSFAISILPSVSRSTIVCLSILGCYLYYLYFGIGFFLGGSNYRP